MVQKMVQKIVQKNSPTVQGSIGPVQFYPMPRWGKLRPHKNKNKNKSIKTTKEALWEAVGQNEQAINLHFRWYVLAELVRRKGGRTYVSQHLHS